VTTEITPDELAGLLDELTDSGLFGFDVDGVLAPIVEHAGEARLLSGTRQRLAALAERTTVAILSGRALDDLERLFHFPTGLHVIGSHGLEARSDERMQLDPDERSRFAELERLGLDAVAAAGEGAWLEYKPASVVVHTRSADTAAAQAAVEELIVRIGDIDEAQVKAGHEVVELLVREASKGDALIDLARDLDRSPIVFFGDDLTDEDAFSLMGPDDTSVRVGPGDTVADYRIGGPDDVAEVIDLLVR
jgi:trehalose 6-phosphate phosphatase